MPFKVTNHDGLPEKMCLNCISEMNQAFAFKQKCERSEKTLCTYLAQMNLSANISLTKSTNSSKQIKTISFPSDVLEPSGSFTESINYPIQVIENQSVNEVIVHSENCGCTNCTEDVRVLQYENEILTEMPTIEVNNDEKTKPSKCKAAKEIVKDFIAESTFKFECSDCKASFSS